MRAEQISKIVGLARFSPTGDNCQPFIFEWARGTLRVLHNSVVARSYMNPRNRASILALGCLIEILEMAARAEGYRIEITQAITDSTVSGTAPWLSVRFQPAEPLRDPLLDAVEIRSTDRRIYQGGSPSHPVFARILRENRPESRCQNYFLAEPSQALSGYILDCDAFLWRDRHAVGSLLEWVHFSRVEAAKTRTGMHWTNLGVGFADSLALRAIQCSSFWAQVFGPLGGEASTRRVLLRQLRSSAALGCVTTKGYGTPDFVAAGRRYLRSWLSLNLEGHAFQPISLPLFFPNFLAEGIWEVPMLPGFKELYSRGLDVFRKAFEIPKDEIPLWAFRTGINPPLPTEMRTYRKEVSELLTVLD